MIVEQLDFRFDKPSHQLDFRLLFAFDIFGQQNLFNYVCFYYTQQLDHFMNDQCGVFVYR